MSQPDSQPSEGNSKTIWIMAFTFIVAVVFGVSAITQADNAQKQAASAKHVKVIIKPGPSEDAPPTVDPPSVTLYKNNGDDMEWECNSPDGSHCDFIVVFTESGKKPFKNRGFFKGKGKSGKITGAEDTYKYWVFVNGGYVDPDVIIKGSQN